MLRTKKFSSDSWPQDLALLLSSRSKNSQIPDFFSCTYVYREQPFSFLLALFCTFGILTLIRSDLKA